MCVSVLIASPLIMAKEKVWKNTDVSAAGQGGLHPGCGGGSTAATASVSPGAWPSRPRRPPANLEAPILDAAEEGLQGQEGPFQRGPSIGARL